MTVTDREAPDTVHPSIEEQILAWADGFEQRLDDVRSAVAAMEAHAADVTSIVGPPVHVDLGDPLAMFRLPSGAVGFQTTYVDHVAVGEWVQRCAGDLDWHQVTDIEELPEGWRRLVYGGLAHDWLGTDAIRVARPAADVIARQDRGR